MNKLYSSLLAIALCGMTAGAATVSVPANGLADAVAAAADGDVLVLTADQTLNDRLSFPKKTITIQGQTADIKIVRECNKMLLLSNSGADITFKDLTIEGGNYSPNAYVVEISGTGTNAAKAVFENVTFANCNSGTSGTVQIKNSGTATFNNCKFTNCTVGETSANIFVGNNNVTVAGTTSASLYLERRISAADDYSGNCEVWLKKENFSVGANVVLNASKGFTLKGYEADYSLQPNGANLALAYNKTIVRNETTGAGYSDLTSALDAMTAPEEGQPEVTVLTVLENADFTKRVGPFTFPVTIKGEGEGVTITRTFASTALSVSNNANMTFENLTIDANDKTANAYEVEANQNNTTLAFTDVTIVNSNATKGIFTVKDGNRVLALNNVTATVAEGKIGVNLNGKLQLSGNNNVPVLMANAGAQISVTGELTNTTPISISYADGIAIEKGQVVVNGCTDPTKFKLVHDDLVLVAKDGNLVAGDSTSSSIDEIEATEAEIVNVYSLQGVVLKEGVEASKATEGLAPGLYIVGGKKMAVR